MTVLSIGKHQSRQARTPLLLARRLTPAALAIPTELAIEFDIRWEAEQAELFGDAEIVGEDCR